MSEWVKAMGVDYGTARIGLAVSDDIGMLAHPLETVPAANLDRAARRIAELVRERRTEHLVVGLPLHMNGEEGEAVKGVRQFVALLRPMLPDSITLHEVDERLTTTSAMEKLHAAGRNTKNSRKIIDQAAAMEILQQWLDRRSGY
ncbi:MAG TPA: Holliday junction resolvase RuvX [Verrucomicrobiales bacterium]|nr:Holliday junction resolvase RuvX [Verrucomicrobiales bacterium]